MTGKLSIVGDDAKAEPFQGPEQIRTVLREMIFAGTLPAGTPVSQVQLAKQLSVSRTPLREALRMLEAEGLVEAERNRRMRVAGLSVTDLENAYAERIVLEAFAVRLTVQRLDDRQIADLRECLVEMEECGRREDFDGWEAPHQRFHDGLVQGGGPQLVRHVDQLHAHGRRFRSHYVTRRPTEAWSRSAVEHEEILSACLAGETQTTGDRLARHLAQTALTMIAAIDPAHDPLAIRTALRTVCGAGLAG